MEIVKKKREDLEPSERDQFTDFIKTYIPGINQEYIDERVLKGPEFDIVLLKDKEELQAVSCYHLSHLKTPFSKKEIPVLHFGTSMKSRSYKGNTIWKLGNWYGKHEISPLYMLKRVAGVTHTYNPKVFENFIRLFKCVYPYPNGDNQEVLTFLKHYLNNFRGINYELDDHFCFHDPNVENTDITDDWERSYKAKSEEVNELFKKLGIIEERDGRIIRTGRHIVACGYRNPLVMPG